MQYPGAYPPQQQNIWGQRVPWYAKYYNMCSPQLVQQIYSWFYAIDTDRNGTLDVNEVGRALQQAQLNYQYPTLIKLMQAFDLERRGHIRPNEFVALYQFLMGIKNSFVYFDRDRSGTLERGELVNALAMSGIILSPQSLDAILFRVDPQRTGRLNMEQYTELTLILANLRSYFDNFKWSNKALKHSKMGKMGMVKDKRHKQPKPENMQTVLLTFDQLVGAAPYFQ